MMVAIVLVMDAVAIFFWNYAFFSAALAAAVLILVDLSHPSNYSAEGYRVLWTLCGAAIAFLVMLLAGPLMRRAPAPKQPAPAGQAG